MFSWQSDDTGDQLLCLGVMTVSIETCPKAVGSEAYVHLVTFAAYDAVNEGCIFACKCFMERIWCLRHCGKKDMSSFGLRTNLTAFVSTPYILDSILVMGMGGTWHVGGWRDPGSDAFTREAARVGFLRKLSWEGAGKIDEREGSSNISVQCLFNNVWREV